jgi:putative MATE family efflux protein
VSTSEDHPQVGDHDAARDTGDPRHEILTLAVPALGALVLEPLFLLADSAVVGRLGTAPLAGLGLAGALLASAVNVFVFLAYGSTAAVARQVGAGDRKAALTVGTHGLWLAAGLGSLTAVIGWPTAPALVALFTPDAELAALAVTYLRWSLPGVPAMLVVLAATGVLRGLQDTRTPLRVAGVAAVVNTLLNLLLVHGVHLGIAGSAIGTAITQVGAAVVTTTVVVRAAKAAHAPIGPSVHGVLGAARDGGWLLVRTLALRAALLLTTAVAARLGASSLAAHQVTTSVWMLLALALDALAIAAQALTGRALGAGDRAGTRAATSLMIRWGVLGGAATGAVVILLELVPLPLGGGLLAPLFTDDPAVATALRAGLLTAAVLQPVAGYVFVLDGVLIGAGDGRYLARTGLAQLAGYLPLALAVGRWAPPGAAGLAWLWAAFAGGYLLMRAFFLRRRSRGEAWMVTGPNR